MPLDTFPNHIISFRCGIHNLLIHPQYRHYNCGNEQSKVNQAFNYKYHHGSPFCVKIYSPKTWQERKQESSGH